MMNERIDYDRIQIYGKKISNSWWGQEWCRNIENFSGLASRLERGRTYIRKDTIKSLTILNNKVVASVLGTSEELYKVIIQVDSISRNQYNNILEKCTSSIDDVEILISGSFPDEFKCFLNNCNYGLLPQKKDIHYSCTCMDYKKYMHICKHIAATLYAVGNKLDTNPLLFFELRGVDTDYIINNTVRTEKLFVWKNVNEQSNRKIESNQMKAIFGIEYDEESNKNIDVGSLLDINKNSWTNKVKNMLKKLFKRKL